MLLRQFPIYSNKLFSSPQIEPGWQRNCSATISEDEKIFRGGERLKNFDQWMEELLKDAFFQAAEDDRKVLLKADEAFADDDFEEE